jgi:glycosyltransferase involved in cell wall biosynthesis
MIYYFLPDRGHFGGVKVACQFVEMLNTLNVPAVICLPSGRAPEWFPGRFAVLDEADAMRRITDRDTVMITWPPDHRRLADLPGRRACHVQGTDPLMDPILADPDYLLLTCWDQATEYVRSEHGRTPIQVGISISECFFYRGGSKLDNLVTYMPRRGFRILLRCLLGVPAFDFRPVDGLDEAHVSRLLQRSGVFLASAVGEQFGLPALEAMAAGCVVVSVPVKGGMEYLLHGENCIVAEPEDLPNALDRLSHPSQSVERVRMRHRAVQTALAYRPRVQRRHLSDLLRQGLAAELT